MESLESLYGLEKKEVALARIQTKSGKWLEVFASPGSVLVDIEFPEFTCNCPRTSQPDFATIRLIYVPDKLCCELKSLKYYLNSFRNEGHFHEEVTWLIAQDFVEALKPLAFHIVGEFNVRGGTSPIIETTYKKNEGWTNEFEFSKV